MHIQLTTLAVSPYWERESVLLAKTLRKFGGELADAPLTVLHPEDRPLPEEMANQLAELSVDAASFAFDEQTRGFPLAVIPFGAAAAERKAQDADLLVWMLADALILNPPVDFLLEENKQLAYRPVHHQNVGSPWRQPLDPFWKKIYKICQVPEERVFEMTTCYQERVRPYFNAGLLVTRPQNGLFQAWLETFLGAYRHPDLVPFFEQQRYAIFLHQAVLAGVILNRFPQEALAELPERYNYPLHLHDGYPPAGKVSRLADLVTARYENAKDLSGYAASFEDLGRIGSI